jgi:integrase
MSRASKSFRIGKVQAYLRNKVWYLCYHDQSKRFRPRVGPCSKEARKLAAQINGQVESQAPASLSFELISIPELRVRWLEHHEQVLRSSPQTVDRYRTATDHLLTTFFVISTNIRSGTPQPSGPLTPRSSSSTCVA